MHARVIETRLVEVKRVAQSRIAKAQSERLCVACMEKLDGSRTIRGCHERCYRATLRAILAGRTTEQERVADGKLLERDTPGRNPSNPVSVELEA